MATYVDTSALVKRCVHEPSLQAFDDAVATKDEFVLKRLPLAKKQSLLMRRLRQRDVDRAYLKRLRGHFDNDLRGALWVAVPFPIETLAAAVRPIDPRCGLSIQYFSS